MDDVRGAEVIGEESHTANQIDVHAFVFIGKIVVLAFHSCMYNVGNPSHSVWLSPRDYARELDCKYAEKNMNCKQVFMHREPTR